MHRQLLRPVSCTLKLFVIAIRISEYTSIWLFISNDPSINEMFNVCYFVYCLSSVLLMCHRDETHKDVVVGVCERRQRECGAAAASCSSSSAVQQRHESRELLWAYLALLVRQNGKLCSADLAGLLVNSADACLARRQDSATDNIRRDSADACLDRRRGSTEDRRRASCEDVTQGLERLSVEDEHGHRSPGAGSPALSNSPATHLHSRQDLQDVNARITELVSTKLVTCITR